MPSLLDGPLRHRYWAALYSTPSLLDGPLRHRYWAALYAVANGWSSKPPLLGGPLLYTVAIGRFSLPPLLGGPLLYAAAIRRVEWGEAWELGSEVRYTGHYPEMLGELAFPHRVRCQGSTSEGGTQGAWMLG
ncbi:hypothetical protein Droror1_Dr00028311, partial [Drosera rotundifolia]